MNAGILRPSADGLRMTPFECFTFFGNAALASPLASAFACLLLAFVARPVAG